MTLFNHFSQVKFAKESLPIVYDADASTEDDSIYLTDVGLHLHSTQRDEDSDTAALLDPVTNPNRGDSHLTQTHNHSKDLSRPCLNSNLNARDVYEKRRLLGRANEIDLHDGDGDEDFDDDYEEGDDEDDEEQFDVQSDSRYTSSYVTENTDDTEPDPGLDNRVR